MFCSRFNEIISNRLNISIQKLGKNKNISLYSICGNNNIRKIYNFLYSDATLFLSRKKDKLGEVFNYPLHVKTSKYIGVSFNKVSNKWLACKYIKNKQIGLGYYNTEEDANNA